MKVRTIESQTTRPCCTQPQPADFQHSWRDYFWPNLKDTLIAFCLIVIGYLVWIGLIALYTSVRGG